MSKELNAAQEAVAIHQFRHHDSSDWYDVTPEDHPHVFNDPDFVVRTVYSAPAAAAPVGMTRDDAEQAISRIMGEYGFSIPSRAYAELVDELMSTPAAPDMVNEADFLDIPSHPDFDPPVICESTPEAPGIDLRNALQQLREDALHMKDPGDTVNAYDRVLRLIDASPKGVFRNLDYKADFFDANGAAVRAEGVLLEVRDWFETQAKVIGKGCGSSWDLQQVRDMRDRCDSVLQAPSAE